MTELDPNQTPPEPGEERTEGEEPADAFAEADGLPADAANTPVESDGPPSNDDRMETETASDEEDEDHASRALTIEDEVPGEPQAEAQTSAPPPQERVPERTHAAVSDDTSDVASIPDEPTEDPKSPSSQLRVGDWQAEMSAHRIAVELKRIETRIRELLSERDSRRKRKLAGTYRWHELEEDIIAWRAERRFDTETLEELHRLTCRRHFLFNQLRFAASTRPTWNS